MYFRQYVLLCGLNSNVNYGRCALAGYGTGLLDTRETCFKPIGMKQNCRKLQNTGPWYNSDFKFKVSSSLVASEKYCLRGHKSPIDFGRGNGGIIGRAGTQIA